MTQVSSGASGTSQALTDGNEKKTTKIVWKADPEALLRRGTPVSSSGSVEISRLRHWLELECHKSAGLRVLVMASTLHSDIIAEMSPFITGETPYRGFAQLTIACSSDDALQQWKTQTEKAKNTVIFTVWNGISDMGESKFDLIIAGHPGARDETSGPELAHWQHAMTLSGRIIIAHGQRGKTNGTNGHNTLPDANIAELQVKSSHGPDFSVLVNQSVKATPATEVCLLLPSSSDVPLLARTLEGVLKQENRTTRKVYLDDVASLKDRLVISLLDDSFTTTWNKTEFEHFQTLIASAKHVFWITTGTQMLTSSEAGLKGAPLLGLLRVLRNEFPQITLAHIDLSPTFDVSSARGVELIVDSWKTSVDDTATEKDLELAEVNGNIFLPRVVEHASMDAEIASSKGLARPASKDISTCGPLRLVTGHMDVRELAWENDDEADKPLGPEEVEVSVADISIDPFGSNDGENLGSQLTGRVVQYGSEVTGLLKGDRVAVFGSRVCRTHVRRHQSLLLKLDEHVPLQGSAASIWTLMLAYHVLKHITYLASGNSILIQNGATELGQALLRLASQTEKAKIFATVKNAEQKSQLLQTFRLPKESIIIVNQHEKNASLASYLVLKTQGVGIDIMVSSGLGATIDDDLATCLSDFGRLAVVLGPGQAFQTPPGLLQGNVSFSTIDPVRLILEQPRLVSRLLQNIRQLINDGIRPECGRAPWSSNVTAGCFGHHTRYTKEDSCPGPWYSTR
ncbi:Beta-ketoacyl synthase, partial [Metarhizium brunneum ARSEF 3297]